MPGDNTEGARKVKILASVAYYLFNQGRALFIAGSGEDLNGVDLENVTSEIDTIPIDTDGFRWANAVANFLRYAMQVLQIALQEDHDEQTASLLNDINRNLGSIFEEDEENIEP